MKINTINFLKSISFYNLPILLSAFLSFFSIPLITRSITVEEFGKIELIILTIDLLYIVSCLELEQSLSIYINEEKNNQKSIFSSIFNFNFLILVFLLIFINIINYIKNFFSLAEFIILSFLFLFICFSKILKNLLRYIHYTKFYSIISIGLSLSIFGLNIIFFLFNSLTFFNILCILLFSHFLASIIIFIKINKSYFQLSINKEILKKMLLFSMPLVPASFINFSNSFFDRYLISILLDNEKLGNYSLAYKVGSITSLIFLGVALSLSPIIYNNLKRKKILEYLISNLFITMLFLFGICWIFIILFSKNLILYFGTSEYYSAYRIVYIILPSIILINLWPFFPGLIIAKLTNKFLIINLTSIIINILMSIILINIYGVYGVAFATSFSALVAIIMNYNYSQKYFKSQIKILKLFYIFLPIALLIYLQNIFEMYFLIKLFIFLLSLFYFLFLSYYWGTHLKVLKSLNRIKINFQ